MFRYFYIVIALFFSGSILAQSSTDSPYSSIGIGETGFNSDAYSMGFGGAATALADSSQFNFHNPATYSLLAKQLPLFSFGLDHQQKFYSTQNGKSRGQLTGITHFGLVVPFGNRFGMGASLSPFSRVGYSINSGAIVQGDSIYHEYKGKGNIFDLSLGFSANVLDNFQHTLSLGINAKYYFGRIENTRLAYMQSSEVISGGMEERALRANSFGVEGAISYNYRPTEEHSIRIAATYRPGLNQNYSREENRIFYSDYYLTDSYDTILAVPSVKGKVFIPSKIGVGISYVYAPYNEEKSKSRKRPSFRWVFEYSMEDWANYKEDFNGVTSANSYANSSAMRFGFEFKPHAISLDRTAFINYFDKISYRIGGYFVSTPYLVNGEQIKDKGITLGFGLPFVLGRAESNISLAFNYGTLGNTNTPGMVNEKYVGFNIGINIAPSFDRWFRKYQLD